MPENILGTPTAKQLKDCLIVQKKDLENIGKRLCYNKTKNKELRKEIKTLKSLLAELETIYNKKRDQLVQEEQLRQLFLRKYVELIKENLIPWWRKIFKQNGRGKKK